jgi:hypothetical protein
MKRYIGLVMYVFLSCPAAALSAEWPDSLLKKCQTAQSTGYLTAEEKAVVMYINMVRINPKLFADTYLKDYVDTAAIEKTSYLSSLLKDLNNMQAIGFIEPKFDLYEMAKKHATEMGVKGKVGHNSPTGETYEMRAAHLSKRYKKVFENCQYGYGDALSIVIDLLIDEGIPSLSHRKSLLNPEVLYIGVSIKKHKTYVFNTVIELSSEIKKK